ncbi:MAG TPA: 16S rRNA (cytosine(1402)-N(4))-methyltransferase RsmH [Bacteroidota bacterium]|jgi:16S rRNA (cytosine1402-N4)-methyltransferase|nr:16S rRNA (cytosine(1402)-N(4))-methyltransferase RsmH [Bacteroidota bacterium]
MHHEFHSPVLAQEVVTYLHAVPDGVYVDGTLGGGGHTEQILMTAAKSRVIGFDQDVQALSVAKERLRQYGDRVTFIHDNFSNMKARLAQRNIKSVDGILLDLGVSSHQLNESTRGFSFQHDGRLDMRMNQQEKLDAVRVVNTYEPGRLTEIFRVYGEEKNAARIARRIGDERKKGPIETTRALAAIVESVTGKHFLQKSLARIFQAIRIEVNDELGRLDDGLRAGLDCLSAGGRFVVISYHSLEDRIVKTFFVEEAKTSIRAEHKLLPDIPRQARVKILTKKPVSPGEHEITNNPRARSAKLRAIEKVAA